MRTNPPKPKTMPAWLLSLLLHVGLFFVLACVLARPLPARRDEPRRPVAIVLAQTSDRQPQFRSPSELESLQQVTDVSRSTVPPGLPTLETATPMMNQAIQLPRATAGSLGDSRLVDTPQFTVRRGSRVPSSLDPRLIAAEQAAMRRAAEARGPVTEVELFGGGPAAGRRFVFVIDRSKSMGDQGLGGLEAAEQELLRALAALQPQHQFQVIAYHHKCVYLNSRKLLRATEENKAALRGHLSGLAAFGATEHEMALMSALYLKPDVIFLLTDGGQPTLNDRQLARIRKLAGGRTAIHTIQFGFGPLQNKDTFLHRLAVQNGGGYGYVEMSK